MNPDLEKLAPLAEPVRRRLYELVVAASEPVDRDTAAAGAGIGRPLAAFHLDRLVAAGLLEVEFRRRSGRSGPGAGRPAKFYRRPEGVEIAVAVPPRDYRLAAEIFAGGLAGTEGTAARDAVRAVARRHGEEIGRSAAAADGGALLAALRGQGYEPADQGDGTIRLRNCPFHALAVAHRDVTCSMNLALLSALVDASGTPQARAVAEPADGYCCVAVVVEPRTDLAG